MLKRNTWMVVLPLFAGALLLMGLPTIVREVAYAKEKGKSEAAREVLTREQLSVVTNLSAAFQRVAEAVAPAVVTVQSTKNFKVTRHGRPSLPPGLEDSPLRRFFGEDFHFFGPDSRGAIPDQGLRQQGTGSGVVVSADGYILTNNHVIAGSDEVTVVLAGGKEHKAVVVGNDPKTDLAVLKIDATGLVSAPLGNSDALRVGEWVLAIGNPFNLEQTVTAGILSAKGRANVGIADYEDFLQTDAAINPGNSGGPLVNLKGEIVGINTAIATRTGQYAGIGFAIPINMARSIKDSLITNGHVERGFMGVMIQDLTEDLARSFNFESTKGVLIGDLTPDGPAAAAGLQSGDIVTRYDGVEMTNVQQLRNAVAATKPGENVQVVIFRDGKTEKRTLQVGSLEGKASAAADREISSDLGVTLNDVAPGQTAEMGLPPGTSGVVIEEVEPGSMAAFAGLLPKEVITAVNGQTVSNVEQFRRELKKHNLKDGIRLHVTSAKGSRFVYLKDEGK